MKKVWSEIAAIHKGVVEKLPRKVPLPYNFRTTPLHTTIVIKWNLLEGSKAICKQTAIAKQRNKKPSYSDVKFVNLSLSALGNSGASSDSLLSMLKDINLDQNPSNYIS